MKKKLNLDELKVQSFITELKDEHANTAKGGSESTGGPICTSIIVTSATVVSVVESIRFTHDTGTDEYSWWCDSGDVGEGEASEKIDNYGCWLPSITVCG